jgi:hypothetical protein
MRAAALRGGVRRDESDYEQDQDHVVQISENRAEIGDHVDRREGVARHREGRASGTTGRPGGGRRDER